MRDLTRVSASPFDEIRRVRSDGSEYWSARDLQPMLGYIEWRRFDGAIDRAKVSADNTGVDTSLAFVQVTQLVGAANLGDQEREADRYIFEMTMAKHYAAANALR